MPIPESPSLRSSVGHPRCSPIPEEMTEVAAPTPLLYSQARSLALEAAFAIPASSSDVVRPQCGPVGLKPSVRTSVRTGTATTGLLAARAAFAGRPMRRRSPSVILGERVERPMARSPHPRVP